MKLDLSPSGEQAPRLMVLWDGSGLMGLIAQLISTWLQVITRVSILETVREDIPVMRYEQCTIEHS